MHSKIMEKKMKNHFYSNSDKNEELNVILSEGKKG